MSNPQNYFFDLPDSIRPEQMRIPEIWYPGVKAHWQKSTSSRIWDSILGVKTVVIHATAGGSSEGAMSVMKAHKASWHWLVPDEDEEQHGKIIWACAPEARAAWHVRNSVSDARINGGKNRTNHSSLGIEVVNSQKSNDSFSDWQIKITADIVRYCWAKYPNLKHIVSHALLDPTRRSDPGVNFPWNEFRNQVLDQSLFPKTVPIVATTTPMTLLAANSDTESCCMPS